MALNISDIVYFCFRHYNSVKTGSCNRSRQNSSGSDGIVFVHHRKISFSSNEHHYRREQTILVVVKHFRWKRELEDSTKSVHSNEPAGCNAATRRKSTLRLVTEDDGMHNVVLPGQSSINMVDQANDREHKWNRRGSSRKQRWQSTKRRTEDRKSSIKLQMINIREIAKEEQLRSRLRSSSYPTVEEDHTHALRRHSLPTRNPTVLFHSDTQEYRLESSLSKQSGICNGNNQMKVGYHDRVFSKGEEPGAVKGSESYDSKENAADCFVELEDITEEDEDDDQSNSKQETRL